MGQRSNYPISNTITMKPSKLIADCKKFQDLVHYYDGQNLYKIFVKYRSYEIQNVFQLITFFNMP